MIEHLNDWIYRTNWSALRLAGPDAASFLHNMCTNDIANLPEGSACEALFTDVKAHVVAHGIVVNLSDSYVIVVTSPAAAQLHAHLDRYHIREEFEMQVDLDADIALISGERSEGFALAGFDGSVKLNFNSIEKVGGLRQLSDEEFAKLRLAHRFPLDRVDVDQRNLPQEVDRNELLISFTKGCYLGQETVARIDALGRVNQLLRRLELDVANAIAEGETLHVGEKVVGRVTSVAGQSALGYVRHEHAALGSSLECGDQAVKVA